MATLTPITGLIQHVPCNLPARVLAKLNPTGAPPVCFNPSAWGEWMLYRVDLIPQMWSRIAAYNRRTGANHLLELEGDPHVEDPRLFYHADSFWVAYNNGTRMHLAQLDRDLIPIRSGRLTTTFCLDPIEKNWAPFSADGLIYLIRDTPTHEILVVDTSSWETHRVTRPEPWAPLRYANPRGGVVVGPRKSGTFVHFYHRSWPAPEGRRYGIGAYTFSAKSPFRPLHHYSDLFTAPKNPDGGWSVVFPGGAERKSDGSWRLSVGLHDKSCAWLDLEDFGTDTAT